MHLLVAQLFKYFSMFCRANRRKGQLSRQVSVVFYEMIEFSLFHNLEPIHVDLKNDSDKNKFFSSAVWP